MLTSGQLSLLPDARHSVHVAGDESTTASTNIFGLPAVPTRGMELGLEKRPWSLVNCQALGQAERLASLFTSISARVCLGHQPGPTDFDGRLLPKMQNHSRRRLMLF